MELIIQAFSSEWHGVYLVFLSTCVVLPVLAFTTLALSVRRLQPKALYAPLALIIGLVPSSYILGTQYSPSIYFWLFVLPGTVISGVIIAVSILIQMLAIRLAFGNSFKR
jgi:hypothetical protein